MVFTVVLGLAGRNEALSTMRMERVRHELQSVLEDLDVIYGAKDD